MFVHLPKPGQGKLGSVHRHRGRRGVRAGAAPLMESLEGRLMLAAQLLPDLVAWADEAQGLVHDWSLDTTEIPGRTLIRFSTSAANQGAGAMELRGGPSHPDGTQDVFQRIYNDMGGFTDRLAGLFEFHPSHGHVHFEGFAQYTLREVDGDGDPGAVVAAGEKTSFCLLDVEVYDNSLGGFPLAGQYHDCGAVQGISVGWADIYNRSLPDQWIDITDVPDGDYWLEVVIDPDGHVTESDETNNSTAILVTINAAGGGADAFEPNDSRAQATQLGPLGDRSLSGLSLHAAGNDDFFTFTAAQSGPIDITLNFLQSVGDLDLELLDANGALLDAATGPGDGAMISSMVEAGLIYFIRVLGPGGSVNRSYSLVIDGPGSAPPQPDHLEPNNSMATARNLGTLGDRTERGLSIHQPGDEDYYRFTAAASGMLDLEIDFEHSLGDLDLALLNAAGTVLESSETSTDHEHAHVSVVAGQTYFIHVYGFSGATNPDYTLTINGPGGPIAGDRMEINDTPQTATDLGLLSLQRVEENLSIHIGDAGDHFLITAAESGRLEARIDFLNTFGDLDMTLSTVAGAALGSSTSTANFELISLDVLAGQQLILNVYGYSGATNPQYGLTLTLSHSQPTGPGGIEGVVWSDKNANGLRDKGELNLAGIDVYLDLNRNGVFDAPQTTSPTSTNVPLRIPPTGSEGVTISTLTVPASFTGTIRDLDVKLSLTHTFDSDLAVTLISPGGMRITLFEYVGDSGDNFTNTLLDDEAAAVITDQSAPFTGSFRPESPLSALDGTPAAGIWKLEISDDASGDFGQLLSWGLVIQTGDVKVTTLADDPITDFDESGRYSFVDLAPGSYQVAVIVPFSYLPTNPGTLPGRFEVEIAAGGLQTIEFGLHDLQDVNLDGVLNARDIDALFAITGPLDPPAGHLPPAYNRLYDLNGDAAVNLLDVVALVEHPQYFFTRFGDATMNRVVSIGDLTVLAEHFGGPGGWGDGDFNGDGLVSLGDLVLLADHFVGPTTALEGQGDGGADDGVQAASLVAIEGMGAGADAVRAEVWRGMDLRNLLEEGGRAWEKDEDGVDLLA